MAPSKLLHIRGWEDWVADSMPLVMSASAQERETGGWPLAPQKSRRRRAADGTPAACQVLLCEQHCGLDCEPAAAAATPKGPCSGASLLRSLIEHAVPSHAGSTQRPQRILFQVAATPSIWVDKARGSLHVRACIAARESVLTWLIGPSAASTRSRQRAYESTFVLLKCFLWILTYGCQIDFLCSTAASRVEGCARLAPDLPLNSTPVIPRCARPFIVKRPLQRTLMSAIGVEHHWS